MPFGAVIGHARQIRLLSGAAARGTLPPSLVLTGPSGVGKRRVAAALAQVLNCPATAATDSVAVDACGTCSPCGRIERGTHPDVVGVGPDESGSIKVDQVRQVTAQGAYKPFEGRVRVVIIDEADRLVDEAQSALLKTLEEPAETSQFVLVTALPGRLLPTVHSRCSQLRFGQLADPDVAAVLKRVNPAGGPGVEAAVAQAGGSVGRALALLSGDLATVRDAAVTFLEQLSAARDARKRLECAQALLPAKRFVGPARRQELTRRFHAVGSLLRDTVLLASGAPGAGLANPDLADRLRPLTGAFGGRRGVAAAAAVDSAVEATFGNVQPKVVVDWLACELQGEGA